MASTSAVTASSVQLGFNVAAGAQEQIVNQKIVPQLFDALSQFMKGKFQVPEDAQQFNIVTIDYHIIAPPLIGLAPSQNAADCIAESIGPAIDALFEAKGKDPTEETARQAKQAIQERASAATFSAEFEDINLTLHYKNGPIPMNVSGVNLKAHATFSIDDDSNLTLKILTGVISFQNNPSLAEFLNNALLPFLIDMFNKLLKPIKIPPITFLGVTLGVPLAVVQDGSVTVYASIDSSPETNPMQLPWPDDALYVGADISTMEALLKPLFPIGPPPATFSWEIFSGSAGAKVYMPNVTSIDDDGNVHVTVTASAHAQLTFHIPPIPPVTFGPQAAATIEAVLKPAVEDGQLVIYTTTVHPPTFHWTFEGLPDGVKQLIEDLLDGLSGALSVFIWNAIAPLLLAIFHRIPVYDIPDIPIPGPDGEPLLKLTLDDGRPSGIYNSLLVAAFDVSLLPPEAKQ